MFNRCLLLCLLAIATVAVHAQSPAQLPARATCPWLNEGSAAKALGAAVSVTVNVSNTGEGACNFSRKDRPEDRPASFLKIEVSKAMLPSCGAESTKLKGVGNEAMRCKLPGSANQDAEMISGRVRDLHFTIMLIAHEKSTPASSPAIQQDVLEQIAEQVSGNLF
jgi:hypothetical protein